MNNNKITTKKLYKIIIDNNGQTYAVCATCYKEGIITPLSNSWKPYEFGEKQKTFHYYCPKHIECSIICDIELPIKS